MRGKFLVTNRISIATFCYKEEKEELSRSLTKSHGGKVEKSHRV